ncbi:alkylresorcinol/alkylpyrone synthase [Oikeobacillus pervagus]|uniref:Alkylresorcinol/alkylpyrone synthase n=1 Tax=Oikeobacillus pervagus TaxID=1325931 RepID=A0AAJ1T1P5_9BACI|nr:3-oxoacyl-[acyl-carrier-protein] synthase III C-terminal domain-containing protein [Oikeobacillus pervagus]MDQ0213636.1 alkylresorcinol/alkylpyrone synthase [Oikeobacillus pervagus]
MAKITSVGFGLPTYCIPQEEVERFIKETYQSSYPRIHRLLKVFKNSEIKRRRFVRPMDWYREPHTFEEKNHIFIEEAIQLGCKAIEQCLQRFKVDYKEIDAIYTICSTGLATPSIEARIMNELPFHPHVKRTPIWGLGCAGGVAGLARAGEFCKAFPQANVLVLAIELCSLTFQLEDLSKSNLIGTSLFADGVACCLVCGDESTVLNGKEESFPTIIDHQATLIPHSLDVMGWEIKNDGLFVIFSKDIPTIVHNWFKPNVEKFLEKHHWTMNDIQHFIAHPGGKKVIEAYRHSLSIPSEMTADSMEILKEYGNMSSATVLYVLERFMKKEKKMGDIGLAVTLGPGFSSDLLLMRWE